MESPTFNNKTHQELFYQYQIANTIDDEEIKENPVEISYIKSKQDKDENLKTLLKDYDEYHTKIYHGAGKSREMICHKDKIVISQTLKSKIIEWYHYTLLHPGSDRTRETINQHLYWKGMRHDV